MNLSWIDYLVIGVPIVLVFAVSLYLQRYMRSVADFLAANRSAGRYLICTSMDAGGSNVMALLIAMEIFSHSGFSVSFWKSLGDIFFFVLGILGLVSYRFRETRSLTFHQFFEVRYSKGIRIFASFLNVFSGAFNFGITPAIVARFFVYYCGMPVTLHLGNVAMPTFIVVMLVLMAASVWFAMTGGQISVMVTDCLEGLISAVFYLVVGIFIVCVLSTGQMKTALLSGPPGASYVDPFDIGARSDFGVGYLALSFFLTLYYFRGNSWASGFAAAARSAHELRMAQILSSWRSLSYGAMGVLVSVAAFTVLHCPDFAPQQHLVAEGVAGIDGAKLQNQMSLPLALGLLLAPGVKGAFFAILLMGVLASQGQTVHIYGSALLQDVVLPLRKEPFTPRAHIFWLRAAILGISVFACVFSSFFKPADYLTMIVQLIGAIYLGGIGLVVWGGLYWKKGTTAGAYTAMALAAILGIAFNLEQQLWVPLDHLMTAWFGTTGAIGRFFAAHPDESPVNDLQLAVFISAIAGVAYVTVSLLTCREDFNLDAMLHRGKYRIAAEDPRPGAGEKRSLLSRLLDMDEHFTTGDKALTVTTVAWTFFWKAVAVAAVLWTLFVARLSPDWWFGYSMLTSIWLTLILGCVVTVWFLFGVTRDLGALVQSLRQSRRNDADDGTVKAHHNLGEPELKEKPRLYGASRN
jgi:solute:Na+ symporter, SSS family